MHFPIDSRIVLFADYKGTENFQICKVDDGFHSRPEPSSAIN
jgi:hypothetical protein